MIALGVGVVALAAGLTLPGFGPATAGTGMAEPAPTTIDPHSVMTDPAQARLDYIENCGGCHGVNGDTVPAHLPELEGRVGWFMCTPQARAYLLRLPNVAHSRIRDNGELADLMNYVVFVLGEGSVPKGTAPFTADEVARERLHALTNTNLTAERLRLANQLITQCHAPASIKLLYPGDARPGIPDQGSSQ
ncbi:cytochrome C [Novosphingobium sp.]|uniref:cytochrome C n=1 Tax=Novosphingobium sp. TaxID=1874826 RepID=UPI00333ED3C4